MKILCRIMVIAICVVLSACSRHDKKSDEHLVTLSSQSLSNNLFYSGIIHPLKAVVIPNLVDGVIVDMPFQYGESVKAGQLLFMISSEKFLTDYKSALMQYIKSKNDFDTTKTQLTEAKFLHKNELISDDDFKTKQSNYYAAQLALLQARDLLDNLLHQLNIKNIDLYKLTIADIDKINQVMNLQKGPEKYLRILAPASGVVLSPIKSEEDNKKIAKGDTVKQGDVLALIGDMSGLSVNIKVNELTINRLKPGQKVKVTGIAFPDETLEGEIRKVDTQGEITNGSVPQFNVEVIVRQLSLAEQNDIHVGMSAKVEIAIDEKAKLMVPFNAVVEKNGDSFVKRAEKNGRVTLALVKTGKTTMDAIEILSGLNVGDKIVVPY